MNIFYTLLISSIPDDIRLETFIASKQIIKNKFSKGEVLKIPIDRKYIVHSIFIKKDIIELSSTIKDECKSYSYTLKISDYLNKDRQISKKLFIDILKIFGNKKESLEKYLLIHNEGITPKIKNYLLTEFKNISKDILDCKKITRDKLNCQGVKEEFNCQNIIKEELNCQGVKDKLNCQGVKDKLNCENIIKEELDFHNKSENNLAHENTSDDKLNNENLTENNSTNENITENNSTNENITENNSTNENLTEDNLAHENLTDDKLNCQNKSENNLAHENITENILAHENLTEDKLINKNIIEKKIINENITEDKLIYENIIEDNYNILGKIEQSKYNYVGNYSDMKFLGLKLLRHMQYFSYYININLSDLPLREFIETILIEIIYAKFYQNEENLLLESYLIEFIVYDSDIGLSMLYYDFYEDTVEDFFNKKRNDKKFVIKSNDNIFLEDLLIQINLTGISIGDINFSRNKKYKKNIFYIDFQISNYISNIISVYNEMINFEYKVCFFIFNSTKNTDIFDKVIKEMVITSCTSPDTFIFYVVIQNMGFITKENLITFYKERQIPDSVDIENLIKNLKSEINGFINNDIYKLFVLVYFIKYTKIVEKDPSIYSILQEEKFVKYLYQTKLRLSSYDERVIRNRDPFVNGVFNSDLFYLFAYSLSYQKVLNNSRDDILQNITVLFLLIFDGKNLGKCLSTKPNKEAEIILYDVSDLDKIFNDKLN